MGGGFFRPELGSVIVGGYAEAKMAILSRDGLFGRRGLLAPLWLSSGLKVFLSLSNSALALEPAPAADMLWTGRISLLLSRLSRLGLDVRADMVQVQSVDEGSRFRFSGGSRTGVNGGDRVSVRCKVLS